MFVVAFSLLTGCTPDVGKDKVAAEVTEVKAEAKAEVKAPAAGDVWQVDASASKISALSAKQVGTHPIDFKTFAATVNVAGDQVTSVDFSIDMPTLESDDPKLTKHLLNEDFFNVEKFPKATFKSKAIKAGSDKEGFTHSVTGVFTIVGTSKEITFPAKIEVKDDMAHATTEFVLDRNDFGIVYKGMSDNLIQDNVVLTVDFKAKKG